MIPTIKQGNNQRNLDYSDFQEIIQNSSTSTEVLSYTFLVDEENFNFWVEQIKHSIVPQFDESLLLFKYPNVEIKIKKNVLSKGK